MRKATVWGLAVGGISIEKVALQEDSSPTVSSSPEKENAAKSPYLRRRESLNPGIGGQDMTLKSQTAANQAMPTIWKQNLTGDTSNTGSTARLNPIHETYARTIQAETLAQWSLSQFLRMLTPRALSSCSEPCVTPVKFSCEICFKGERTTLPVPSVVDRDGDARILMIPPPQRGPSWMKQTLRLWQRKRYIERRIEELVGEVQRQGVITPFGQLIRGQRTQIDRLRRDLPHRLGSPKQTIDWMFPALVFILCVPIMMPLRAATFTLVNSDGPGSKVGMAPLFIVLCGAFVTLSLAIVHTS